MPGRSVAAFGAALLALSPFTAAGAEPASSGSAVVSFGDLSIGTAEGRKTLQARIEAAAVIVCRPSADIHDLRGVAADRACLRGAVARALSEVPSVRARGRSATLVLAVRR
jgi:UrcA family protein